MKRLTMRKIKEAMRLQASGLSTRKIAASLGVGHSTATDYMKRVRLAGLTWPLPTDMTDAMLETLLFHPSGGPSRLVEAQPDWALIHRELRRPGVTLSLLWEEYRGAHPEGYGYSRFCDLYRRWAGRLTPVMRQHHVAGERVFVDYAGTTLPVIDGATGEVRQAQLFVAALGASNLTYAEASWSQSLSDWIGAHSRAFTFFGGVPAQVVCDNLKSGVTKACFYEPAVNRTYADMAEHYGTAVVPARPWKPRDKAKVEVAVQIAERWIIARLRNQQFFSLSELNTAIRALLDHLNDRVTRHLAASRREIFDLVERAALKPLPTEPYVFSEWKQCTVGLDYHVEVGKHYYSAPHNLLREKVWVRLTARTVEIFHQGQRVAAHVRTSGNRQHTTIADHMPASHRRHSEWSPERLKAWAAKIGPNTATLVEVTLRDRSHPEQGFRSCLGIMRLTKPHGPEALEAACERALIIGARSYSSVHSILKNNLHRAKPEPAVDGPAIQHGNIRGPGYFH
jgi:transposase